MEPVKAVRGRGRPRGSGRGRGKGRGGGQSKSSRKVKRYVLGPFLNTFSSTDDFCSKATVSSDDEAEEGEEEEEEADDEAPALLNPDLPNLRAVLAAADVVVHVLDARDPAATRSAHLEEVTRELGKRLVLVLSKIGMS